MAVFPHGIPAIFGMENYNGEPITGLPKGASVYSVNVGKALFARVILKFWPDYSGPKFETWVLGRMPDGTVYPCLQCWGNGPTLKR